MGWVKNVIKTAASMKLTVFCLFMISIVVVGGTFYQVDNGVYAAQKRFFDSWAFLAFGLFPFPGLRTIISVLCLNLVASGACRFSFRMRNIGIFLMHAGTVALIAGTAFSSFLIKESSLSLYEGDGAAVSFNYDKWEFAFYKKSGGLIKRHGVYDFTVLKHGQSIPFKEADLSIQIDKIYQNCSAFGRSPHTIDSLQPKPQGSGRGTNIPGLILSFIKNNGAGNTRVVLYGGAGAPAHFISGNDTLLASVQPFQMKLPVRIELINFTKEDHPGTRNAKSYKSRVRVTGSGINREAVISMNRPFRYRSFTFYQTGYTNEGGQTSSTLSVVENPVRFVPYITGIIIMIGLLYHFIYKFLLNIPGFRRN